MPAWDPGGLLGALERLPGQQAERAEAARHFQELATEVKGIRLLPPDPRITRWSFYRYIALIEPEAFAGATNRRVCEALEAEGVGAWEGYEPMSRYDLFQPALSRLPVAVEHADRLDPARMSFPVAEDAGLRRTLYLDENVFRAGRRGIEDAVEALAKVQRHAAELTGDA